MRKTVRMDMCEERPAARLQPGHYRILEPTCQLFRGRVHARGVERERALHNHFNAGAGQQAYVGTRLSMAMARPAAPPTPPPIRAPLPVPLLAAPIMAPVAA